MAARYGRGPRCHYCKKIGHIKQYCDALAKSRVDDRKTKQSMYKVLTSQEGNSESIGLMVRHACQSMQRPKAHKISGS